MPIYEYKGYGASGKVVKGVKDADSVKSLRLALRKEGILATEITEASGSRLSVSSGSGLFQRIKNITKLLEKVSVAELGMATRQLATLLGAGVPMVGAFTALIEQVENETFKRVLSSVKSDINEGTALADALQKHSIFTNIYVNMVKAGERSGKLEIVLERLSEFMEGQARLKSKVISAMTYPLVMMSVAVLVMLVMLTSVIPSVAQVFTDMKAELPFATRFLIASSNIIRNYWWLVLGLIAVSIYAFRRYVKTPKGRAKWDRMQLRLPIMGPILRLVAIARFSRTLSTLLNSGVPLLASLQIVRNVVANDALEVAVDRIHDAVKEGEDIATPLKRSGEFPPVVAHMIAIGEKSGQLETMLSRIASSYEEQVESKVETLTSLLEPVMILVMGGTVAFMIFAILMPIMEMSNLVQ